MGKFWPDVMGVLREINSITPHGATTPEQKVFLSAARRSVIEMVRDNGQHVTKALSVYDEAFRDLVANQTPKTFRDFLLSAPYMFLELGEKLGGISHIVSFWRYRFRPGSPKTIDAEELAAIFQDFSSGFGEKIKGESSLIKKPIVIDTTAA
ncbi:MAG TPA: hypothetical protein VHY57_10440, partial [Rhizomicrobium sp.]|nr:hypothetical protein [Rhizomicrobium sp.]